MKWEDLNKSDKEFLLAAEEGFLPTVVARLKTANLDARTRNGRTALHCMAGYGIWRAVEALLDHGAAIDARSDDGSTALHDAAQNNQPAALDTLIRRGAGIDAPDNHGLTPLHCCMGAKSPETARALLRKGANPNLPDEEGDSPLHYAALLGFHAIIRPLMKHGADIELRGAGGHTPLLCAVRRNLPQAARILLACGANVDAVDNDNNTALHFASSYKNNGHTLKRLLAAGSNPTLTNTWGKTALDLCPELAPLWAEELERRHGETIKSIRAHQERMKKLLPKPGPRL